MKKIMFNDQYGLTNAVLSGKKTMTRRIIPLTDTDRDYLDNAFDWDLRKSVIIDRYARYKAGEIVAVAKSYDTLANSGYLGMMTVPADNAVGFEFKLEYCGGGYKNKMFVSANLMPHHIRITDIKVERLQDISDEDCLKEGILKKSDFPKKKSFPYYFAGGKHEWDNSFSTPRKAFAALTDRISGKGTWKRNPWVFAYTFELMEGGEE